MSSPNLILTGMILKVMPVGEYDKRIVLLSAERGKVTAFVRGARRPKSALQAASNLFCFGRFEAYEGKSSYTIVKAEIRNYFREITQDYDMLCYGSYFLELADYFSEENYDGRNQLNLLYVTMKALLHRQIEPKLIRRIYEMRTLVFNGTYPDFFSCISCGSRENLAAYDPLRQGMVCREHFTGHEVRLSPAAVYALQYMAAAPLQKLYSFRLQESVFDEVSRLVERLLSGYVERPLKTAEFLHE